MASGQRTYQWINDQIQEIGLTQPEEVKKRKPKILDFQTGLLVFTCSSLVMIFAGGALVVALVVIYSVLFG